MRKFISNFISIRTAEFLSEEHLRFAAKLSIYEETEESQNGNVMLLDTAAKSLYSLAYYTEKRNQKSDEVD